MNDNVKTLKTPYIFIALITLLILSIILLYSLGFRFAGGLKIGKVGELVVNVPYPDTSIFIDRSEMILTKKEDETVKIKLSPKDHTIIVAKESFYPWKKDFRIQSSKSINFSPILVSQNPSGNIVTQSDPEYEEIIDKINKNKLPTKDLPKKSFDGLTTLWIEDNTIKAKVNETEYEVIKPEETVKNIDFYKDRSDSVIFSAGKGVFVIEIDKNNTQNFMPIYNGESPTFVKTAANYLYIFDVSTLMQVVI